MCSKSLVLRPCLPGEAHAGGSKCAGCQPRHPAIQPSLALLGLVLAAPKLLPLPCSLLLRLPFLLSSRCQLLQLPLHQCPVMRIAKPQALGRNPE